MKRGPSATAAASAANTTGTTAATTIVAAPAMAALTGGVLGSKRKFTSPKKKVAAANTYDIAAPVAVIKAPSIKKQISSANIRELMRIHRDYPQPDSSSGGRITVSYSNIKDKSVTTAFQQYLIANNNNAQAVGYDSNSKVFATPEAISAVATLILNFEKEEADRKATIAAEKKKKKTNPLIWTLIV